MKRFIVEIFGVGDMCLHNTYKKNKIIDQSVTAQLF
jgi:hypothetical protein